MTNIAVLGFGVVGGGIACVLDENRERIEALAGGPVNLKYILDLRDFPDSPYGDRVVHDIDRIIEDESVSIVCEAMGGVHPALEFSLAALNAGKSVVTSNKELVAQKGLELLETALSFSRRRRKTMPRIFTRRRSAAESRCSAR